MSEAPTIPPWAEATSIAASEGMNLSDWQAQQHARATVARSAASAPLEAERERLRGKLAEIARAEQLQLAAVQLLESSVARIRSLQADLVFAADQAEALKASIESWQGVLREYAFGVRNSIGSPEQVSTFGSKINGAREGLSVYEAWRQATQSELERATEAAKSHAAAHNLSDLLPAELR